MKPLLLIALVIHGLPDCLISRLDMFLLGGCSSVNLFSLLQNFLNNPSIFSFLLSIQTSNQFAIDRYLTVKNVKNLVLYSI